MGSAAKRPFWLHQLAEYLMGGALVFSGLQSPEPAMPAIAGVLVLLNASVVKASAFSAFRLITRRVHRLLDPVLIGLTVVGAVQPFVSVESGTRVMMVAVAVVHGLVFVQSNYAERATREPVNAAGGRSEEFGRLAGRAVGSGVRRWRQRS
jgi:hypothetical protein